VYARNGISRQISTWLYKIRIGPTYMMLAAKQNCVRQQQGCSHQHAPGMIDRFGAGESNGFS
jgi:hypothetical protein